MENEINEVLEEGVVNEVDNVSSKTSKTKAVFLGIAAATMGLLVAFRKKISAKVVDVMIKKLSKKGFTVLTPAPNNVSENLFEDLDESN